MKQQPNPMMQSSGTLLIHAPRVLPNRGESGTFKHAGFQVMLLFKSSRSQARNSAPRAANCVVCHDVKEIEAIVATPSSMYRRAVVSDPQRPRKATTSREPVARKSVVDPPRRSEYGRHDQRCKSKQEATCAKADFSCRSLHWRRQSPASSPWHI